ncbi:MAG: flagellar hook-length control protein FliK [Candidatus Melainabacteria bacterium]|nr:flagellar hook-length control protein FliK [Candidatus Melainabacteria bacterium]
MVVAFSSKTDSFIAKQPATTEGVFGTVNNNSKQTNKPNNETANAFEKALKQSTAPKTDAPKKKNTSTPAKPTKPVEASVPAENVQAVNPTEESKPVSATTTPAPAIDTSLAFASVVQGQLASTNPSPTIPTEDPSTAAQQATVVDPKLTQQPEPFASVTPKESSQQHPSEQQQDTTKNNNQSEAFLSNEDPEKSNNLNRQPAEEPPLLQSSTTSNTLLPADIQLAMQPVAPPENLPLADVSVKEVASVVAQVGGQLESIVTNGAGNKQVTMVLQPEALGTVRVQLHQGENKAVSGKIIVQTPEAFTALNQQIDSLKARMEGQGVTVQKLEIVLAPPTDNLVLDSRHHQAVLAASSSESAFNDTGSQQKQQGQTDAGFKEEPEAFSMDKYRQSSSENASQEGQTTANQQDRKEAYQAHLNELRGLRSYRLAMKGSNASSQYA